MSSYVEMEKKVNAIVNECVERRYKIQELEESGLHRLASELRVNLERLAKYYQECIDKSMVDDDFDPEIFFRDYGNSIIEMANGMGIKV